MELDIYIYIFFLRSSSLDIEGRKDDLEGILPKTKWVEGAFVPERGSARQPLCPLTASFPEI